MLSVARRRVGIIMMSAVGDAVHVLPVINALKRDATDTHITWLLKPLPATLVRGHEHVDEILELDTRRGFAAWNTLARQLQQRPFDLVLALQVYIKAGLATRLTKAPVKLGFDVPRARDANWLFTTHRIPRRPRQHVQDQYFEFLAELGVNAEPVEWKLGPWPGERAWQAEFAARVGGPYAVLVTSATDPDRDWIPSRWAAIVDRLDAEYQLRTVLAGGASERERSTAAAIARLTRCPPRIELGHGLRKLVSILDAAALVISVDTGAVHIAVALDRPVITLMSNADPRRTGPYRRFHDLTIDAFRDADDPPEVLWRRRSGRMPRIQVDDVMERVARWARTYR